VTHDALNFAVLPSIDVTCSLPVGLPRPFMLLAMRSSAAAWSVVAAAAAAASPCPSLSRNCCAAVCCGESLLWVSQAASSPHPSMVTKAMA
jgi:hypothetical protein